MDSVDIDGRHRGDGVATLSGQGERVACDSDGTGPQVVRRPWPPRRLGGRTLPGRAATGSVRGGTENAAAVATGISDADGPLARKTENLYQTAGIHHALTPAAGTYCGFRRRSWEETLSLNNLATFRRRERISRLPPQSRPPRTHSVRPAACLTSEWSPICLNWPAQFLQPAVSATPSHLLRSECRGVRPVK